MISILCPTRGRPEWLARMVQSVRDTSSGVEVCCYVDEDDGAYQDYLKTEGVLFHQGPRLTHSDYYNKLAELASGDLLMMAGDDAIYRTPGWDAMVEEAFAACPDKILMVHGDDLGPNGKVFATHPIISRRWVDIVGRFTPPYFSGDWADTWLNDIANDLGRRLLLPFVNEHMHWVWGKAEKDKTYADTDKRKFMDRTDVLYRDRIFERFAERDLLMAQMDRRWSVLAEL